MRTQGLPTSPARVSRKITTYKNKWQNFKLNMSYDLFDFVFHNNMVNKNLNSFGQGNTMVVTKQV